MFRQVDLPAGTKGRLLLHSLPGRYEAIESAFREMRRLDVRLIACLTGEAERRAKSPFYQEAIAQGRLPGKLVECAIPDFGVPPDASAFLAMTDEVLAALKDGHVVLAHCGAGIGRSGMLATLVVLGLGLPLDEAIGAVRRSGSAPETPGQREFLAGVARTRSATA